MQFKLLTLLLMIDRCRTICSLQCDDDILNRDNTLTYLGAAE